MSDFERIQTIAEDSSQVIADAANEIIMPVPIIDPDQRWLFLTMPTCGFAVEVLRQQLERQKIESVAVINRGIGGKLIDDHVVLKVESDDETTYVDPTYLQMFSEFGLDPKMILESLESGTGNILPDERSLTFSESSLDELIDWFTNNTKHLLTKWQYSKTWQNRYTNRTSFPGLNLIHPPTTSDITDFLNLNLILKILINKKEFLNILMSINLELFLLTH
jgi:hypothetical protein